MKKIDMRKKYYVVLDTETCPVDKTVNGVFPSNMWTYDLGFAIVDKKGTVYEKFSFVIYDIFFQEKDLMESAYYAKKIPMYLDDIKTNKRTVVRFSTARKILCEIMKEYNTKIVIAHNARFDVGTLNTTYRWLTKSKMRWFFPFGTEIWDTMKMANDTICKQKGYIEFCHRNDYLTKNGQVRKTAEIIHRYLSGNNEFTESHTGLEDVMIEKEILAYCYKQHKKMEKRLWAKA